MTKTENIHETDGGKITEALPGLYHTLDCALRNESDATKRLQIGLRMGMEREGAEPAAKARQDAIMGRKPRIRVQARTA